MERYINIHSHHLPPSDEEVWTIINIQERDYSFRPTTNFTSNLKGSLGIHPWYIDLLNYKNQLMKVESMLTQNQYVAIGEAGLDRNINTPLDLQIDEQEILMNEVRNNPVYQSVLDQERSFRTFLKSNINRKSVSPSLIENIKERLRQPPI